MAEVVRRVEAEGKRLVLVYEADARRRGAVVVNGLFDARAVAEQAEAAGLPGLVGRHQAIGLGKEAREARVLEATMQTIIDRTGLSLVSVPPSLLRFELALSMQGQGAGTGHAGLGV